MTPGGNSWTLFTPGIWKVLHAVLHLRGLTPYEFICGTWAETPERFSKNPHHEMPGLNTGVFCITDGVM